MFTIPELTDRAVRLFPEKPFIYFNDKIITYANFGLQTSKLADVLTSLGSKKGSKVGYFFPNTPMIAIFDVGIQKIGGVTIPINIMSKSRELTHIINDSEAETLITDDNGYEIISKIRDMVPSLKHVLVKSGKAHDGCHSLDELMDRASDQFTSIIVEPEDLTAVLYTSGTTGFPKGAMQTQKSVYYGVTHASSALKVRYAKEKVLCVMPFFNNFGRVALLTALNSCGSIVLIERFDVEKVLSEMTKHSPTVFLGVPTMFVFLLAAFKPDEHIMSLKTALTAGAKCPSDLMKQYMERFPSLNLVEAYGATELCGICSLNPPAGKKKIGSAGPPIGDAIIKIVDDDGNVLKTLEIGEVVVDTETLIKGYLNDPENTQKAFKPEGWYSGDVGYIDEDGYLFIVERKKDLIIRGGNNIFPAEVEGIICSHSAVSMAAVIGIPDYTKGELPKAFVVLNKGQKVTEDELGAYCRANMAVYKVPVAFEFVEQLPLSNIGKILRRELRELELAKIRNSVKEVE